MDNLYLEKQVSEDCSFEERKLKFSDVIWSEHIKTGSTNKT